MTTVILARTIADAEETAANIGLGRLGYVWPRDTEYLQGVHLDRVVYVSGWERGTLPAEVLAEIPRRLATDAREVYAETNHQRLYGVIEAAGATLNLRDERARRHPAATSLAMLDAVPVQHRGERRSILGRFVRAVRRGSRR